MTDLSRLSLEEYVQRLVDLGKKPESEDFQILFKTFGEEKIRKMARDYWLAKKGETK